MTILSDRLRDLRIKSKYTTKDVSIRIVITERTVQRYEDGTIVPKISKLIEMANMYSVSLDYLTGRTDNPKMLK